MAQVTYTQDWTATGLNNWTTSGTVFSRNATANQICGTTGGTIRGERYYGNSGQFTSPSLTGNNTGQITMSFDYKVTNYSAGTTATPSANIGTINVEYASAATGPWLTASTINSSNHVAANTCATKTITFVPSAGNLFVRFNVTSDINSDVYYYFDNVNISQSAAPTCIAPSAITLVSSTATAANISWTAPTPAPANGYDVYFNTTGVPPSGTTILNATNSVQSTTTTATIPVLPTTTYYVWVRAKCSATDQSFWIPMSTFTTPCAPVTVLPWSENFDAMTTIGTGILPNCWATNGGTSFVTQNASGNSYNDPRSNPNYVTIYYPTTASFLWTPKFSMTANQSYDFSFYYVGDGISGWDGQVLVNNAQSATGATNLTTFITPTQTTTGGNNSTNYTKVKVTFIPTTTGEYTFGVRAYAATFAPYYMGFDDFNVMLTPSCAEPASFILNGATTGSATVSWNAPAIQPANGYEIFYSTTNTPPASPQITGIPGTATTYTIPALTASTTYYIWIRAKCSSTEQSPLAGPVSVYTNYCIPQGGSTSTTYYLTSVATTGGWTNINYTANSFTGYVNTNMSVLTSPGNTVQLNLGVASSTHQFYVWIDWNNDLDFNDPGETVLSSGYLPSASVAINIPAGQALGNYRVRTSNNWSGSNTPCGPASYGNYVDFTLAVVAPPTCLPPTALTVTGVTGNSATLGWATPATPPAGGYEYFVSTSPATPTGAPSGTIPGPGTTVTLPTTLSPLTTYYWWVRAVCSASDKSYLSQGPTFTTTQIPATLPYIQPFTGPNDFGFINGTQVNKWVYGSATGNTGNSLYISNNNGTANAYTIGTTSVTQAFRDILIPAGTTIANFSFDWKAQGEASGSLQYDYLRVWLVPSSFVPTPGTQITAATGRIQVGQYNLQGTWQNFSNTNLNLTNFADSVMRLVFEWRNDGSGGTQPPAAVDNIILRVCSTDTPVVTVTQASITHNSATITWPQDMGGASYQIRYRPVGTTTWLPTTGPITVAGVLTPNNTYTFPQNLLPFTDYEVEVAAVCNTTNIGGFSNNLFKTKCDPTPPNVTVTNITSTSALITWSPLAAGAEYELQWREVGTPTWWPALPSTPQPPANTYLLTGLSSYKTYEVQVRNKCIGSTTFNPWSTSQVFTTVRVCEIPPPGLTITQLNPTSAEVVWDAYTGSGATNNYILRYRKVGLPGWTTVNVSNNTYTITGLLELTKYEMQVANVCTGTPGNFTPEYYFTTPTVVYCPMHSTNFGSEFISKVTAKPAGKPEMINITAGSAYSDFTAVP
ncbi:hypothetical protein DRF62_19875, partial [Chryseobacterium piscium]